MTFTTAFLICATVSPSQHVMVTTTGGQFPATEILKCETVKPQPTSIFYTPARRAITAMREAMHGKGN